MEYMQSSKKNFLSPRSSLHKSNTSFPTSYPPSPKGFSVLDLIGTKQSSVVSLIWANKLQFFHLPKS